ncbi:hypothetical protein ABL78_7888 [Leptomonas seymouri]|uniref:Uncharacterized protein n=1 Tax=Leptomonas seymouri TaxID=5684 RepID=A0A0N1HZW8_LEPSE|nr:hypothetical protein ABL78_7888 [Leptomonas seymouri]|eukprot:KPI83088.1 hypothetical protein ABL78_7888 [Leptomonas seymouri]
MSSIELPHAAALARELEEEMRSLDTLQHVYIKEMVDQLSDIHFLALEDGGKSLLQPSRALSATPHYFDANINAAGANQKVYSCRDVRARDGREKLFAGLSLPIKETQKTTRDATCQSISAASSSVQHKREASGCVARRKHINEQHPLTSTRERNSSCEERSVRRLSSPPTLCSTSPLLLQRSCRVEEAQRARRALQCIREDRDAYFNAKARRAQELLTEGREAVRKSRERRLAAASAASKTR